MPPINSPQANSSAEKPNEDSDTKIMYLRCVGGQRGSMSALVPKVGPYGLNANQLAEDMAEATKDWKGLKMTCKLTIQNGEAKIEVVPSARILIIQALGQSPAEMKKAGKKGNLSLEQITNIARTTRPRSMAKKLEGTVKEILGTSQMVGITVEGQHPHDIIEKIRSAEITIPES